MSIMGGVPEISGETVAGFPSYEGAQKAVSKLIAADVPAKHIAIVGQGLRSIESVTGRLGYAAAARTGAINGVLLGLLFSVIFVFGAPDAAIQMFIGVMLIGIAIGMLLSLLMYSFIRRRRDYASVTQVRADRYEVTVLPPSAQKARQVMGSGSDAAPADPTLPSPSGTSSAPEATPARPASGPSSDEPPRYGERVDPAPEPPKQPPTQPPAGHAVQPPTPESDPAPSGGPASGSPSL